VADDSENEMRITWNDPSVWIAALILPPKSAGVRSLQEQIGMLSIPSEKGK
jgi:hypothetical protein